MPSLESSCMHDQRMTSRLNCRSHSVRAWPCVALAAALSLIVALTAPALAEDGRQPDVREAPHVATDSGPLTRAQVVERLNAATDDHPANFTGADLSSLDLSGLDFKRANLSNAKLLRTKMMHAKMFGVRMDSAVAREADLTGAILDVSTLRNTDFSHATLRDASLYAVIMNGVNFTDADLTGARIIASAPGAIFVRAKLDHADLGADPRNQPMGVMRADLTGADFRGADLSGASLRKAKLTRANLTGANLSDTDLSLAELSGANFHKIVGRDRIKGLDQAKFRDEAAFDPR
jgi:uncharacterized protein YjbI with pentapeptide repeats